MRSRVTQGRWYSFPCPYINSHDKAHLSRMQCQKVLYHTYTPLYQSITGPYVQNHAECRLVVW